MRRWLSVLAVLPALLGAALGVVTQPVPRMVVPGGSSLPATCAITTTGGEVFFKTSATIGLYACTATNTWTLLLTGATVAPIDATYLTQTANGTLTAEQAMGLLGTGLVLNTTTTGVQSIYGGTVCTNQFARELNASGIATCQSVTLTTDVIGDLPFANLVQASAASRLLGRGSAAGAGDWQELTIGSGLTLVGTVLDSAGGNIQTLLDTISTTQGVVIYYNGTDWVALPPGTNGQFLQTQGAAANPQWSTPAGSGDVSSNTATSVVDEVALFADTSGKLLKRSTLTGLGLFTSGVLSAYGGASATAGSYVTAIGASGTTTVSNIGIRTCVVADADDQDADDTLHNDPELLFAAVANAIYTFDLELQFTSGASNTPDMKYAFTYPSGTLSFTSLGYVVGATTVALSNGYFLGETADTSPSTTFPHGVLSSAVTTSGTALRVTGTLRMGVTGGNLQFQFAQNTTTGGTPTVRKADSSLCYTRKS